MSNLEKQLEEHLKIIKENDKNNKDYLSAKKLKEIFLSGFKNQIKLNIEDIFDFHVVMDDNDGLIIECSLNKKMNIACKIFNDFLLKENEELTQKLLSDNNNVEINSIVSGLAQSE